MSQKSSKNLSTLSKHMTNDTKLQLDQNTVTTSLIIPVLAAALIQIQQMEKCMLIVHLIIYLFIKIMHGYKLYKFVII